MAVCEHQFVSTQKTRSVTAQGIFGVVLFLIGLLALTINVIAGAVIALVGVLVGMIGRSKPIIVCAKCGAPAPHQP